jgi:hypothetical protein
MSEFGGAHSVQRIGVLGAGFAGLWAAIGAARKLDEIGIGPERVEVSSPGDQETARWYRSAFVAVAIGLLGMGIAGSASSAEPGDATDGPTTASPIKHVPDSGQGDHTHAGRQRQLFASARIARQGREGRTDSGPL